ncbi:hypothetical protein [Solimonas flava]|uniref:hypothetical protein n=1 Tax=Solimonas flava TaxID=415849 RepID=UPI0012B51C97|nr:hypothetical protein [Solimonas flava]
MRSLVLAAMLVASSSAGAQAPGEISKPDLQHANGLGEAYRSCLHDSLGERYISNEAADPMKLSREIETSCAPQLLPVQRFLDAQGYAEAVVRNVLVEIKAKADGAAIAAVHRLPRYRF